MTNDNTGSEKLQDLKKGKPLPWRRKKIMSLTLAKSMHRIAYKVADFDDTRRLHKKANRIWWCSHHLVFDVKADGQKKLQSARFCRSRLCVMCDWRKQMKVFVRVSKVMDAVEEKNPELRPIFLTLTAQSCKAEELAGLLSTMFLGWRNMTNHRKIKRIVKGWFRALEVTYSAKKDTYHPHFHAILMVEKEYFKSRDYMQTKEWARMWGMSCRLDYNPITDIRAIKANNKKKAVAEVVKYTLKDTDYIYPEDDNLTDTVVDVLRVALKGRRLYAFGGQLKKLASQLGIEEVTEGDLVHIDDEAIRTDVAEAIEVYNWSSGYLNYFLKYQLPHPAYAPKDTRTVAATSSQPHTHSNHQD